MKDRHSLREIHDNVCDTCLTDQEDPDYEFVPDNELDCMVFYGLMDAEQNGLMEMRDTAADLVANSMGRKCLANAILDLPVRKYKGF